jgi:drug/metabolite transporter (DMT)-like permease
MFGKEVMNLDTGHVTFIEFIFFRTVFMTVSSYLLLYGERRSVTDVAKDYRFILFCRCVAGTSLFLLTTLGNKILPLSIYVMILNTAPFMTAIV